MSNPSATNSAPATLTAHRALAKGREGLAVDIDVGDRVVRADLPVARGGGDSGPAPGHLMRASIAACLLMDYRAFAAKLGVPIDEVEVDLFTEIDLSGQDGAAGVPPWLAEHPLARARDQQRQRRRHRARAGAGRTIEPHAGQPSSTLRAEANVRGEESDAMTESKNWIAIVRELGPTFAARAAEHDASDAFVAENYAALKERGLLSAGVPAELGGGGATHAEVCGILRELGHHCSSTALAASMHSHLVATLSFIWRGGNKAPETILKRVATEGVVLISTGGSDWLPGSGKLEKVEGGFRMNGRKIFGSGGRPVRCS
jgi:hypothetical protein